MSGLISNGSKSPDLKVPSAKSIPVQFIKISTGKSADHQKCDYCGTESLVPAGSCFVCYNCGSSQGCS